MDESVDIEFFDIDVECTILDAVEDFIFEFFRGHDAAFAVFIGTDIDLILIDFFLSDDEHIRHLLHFRLTYFVSNFLAAVIEEGTDAGIFEHLRDGFGVGDEGVGDGKDSDLDGSQPSGEDAGEVFDEDTDETLIGAEDGAMDDDGTCDGIIGGDVFELEAFGELEVELDGCALDLPPEGVGECDIDFWAVEGAIFRFEVVVDMILRESACEGVFGFIPEFDIAHEIVRSGGEVEFIGEIEEFIVICDDIEETADFAFDLFGGDEEVGVVLHELTDAGKARERAGEFVSMEDLTFGDAQGEFAVAMFMLLEEEHGIWAIHGLEAHGFFIDVEFEHSVLVMIPVSACFIEFSVVHEWVINFDIALSALNFRPIIMEFFVDCVPLRLPEDGAWGVGVHEEEVEFFTEFTVVTFFCFFLDGEVGVEFSFCRPDGTVDSL